MGWDYIDDSDETHFKEYDMTQLVLDQFYMSPNYNASEYNSLCLYTLNKECEDCPYLRHVGDGNDSACLWSQLSSKIFETNFKFRVATENIEYFPQDWTENVLCDIDHNFGQFGVYAININSSGCSVDTLKEPVNIHSPILTVILIYLALFLLGWGFTAAWKKFVSKAKEGPSTPEKERIRSLDTFRGIAIVIMVFANFGCGGYESINHTKWNGLHIADLVFPWFMWIMGACIPISLMSSFKKNVPNKTMVFRAFKRSVKLFCLGIFLTGGTDLYYLRIFGVLQRFGVAYFICTCICIFCMKRTYEPGNKYLRLLSDVIKISTGWIIVLIILIVHTIIIFTVAAPGCPAGYMGPGGLHKNQSYKDCIGGATGYLDGLILDDHRYQKPTIYKVYESKPYDPEGVIGCLSTIFHVFIGVQAGTTLTSYKKHTERLVRWLMWGIAAGTLGAELCGFSKEDGLIPVNKNLWSLSFVMVTSCFAFFLLSFCYILIDVKKWWSGKPFLFAGMNAILMYIGHEMTDGHFPVRWYLHNAALPNDPRRTHFLALFSDVWGVGVWVLVSYYLYKINYFFTV